MYRVQEFAIIALRTTDEDVLGWAVSLLPDIEGRAPLEPGVELVSGIRRWKVTAVSPFKSGRVGAKLEGNHPLTRGLILRPAEEPVGELEYKACAILLVRLARAFRSVDIEKIREMALSGSPTPAAVATVKTCTFALALVNRGATDEELTAAAVELGIGDEV